VHALPEADGAVRLFRTGGVLAAAANPKAAHGPIWHCVTAEDSHAWSLEFQLAPDAGRLLRECLRPVPVAVAIPSSSVTITTTAAAAAAVAKGRPPRPTTPLAVALLFGHRRHPLPHEQGRRARQAPQPPATGEEGRAGLETEGELVEEEDPWAAALLDGGGSSRPSSLRSKRGSRGRKTSWWGGVEGEEGKADDGGDGQSSYYHSVRDGASSLASSCASSVASLDGSEGERELRDGVNCWVRTGELSSSGEEEDGDDESVFREVGLDGA
jgi:hypothetical protein